VSLRPGRLRRGALRDLGISGSPSLEREEPGAAAAVAGHKGFCRLGKVFPFKREFCGVVWETYTSEYLFGCLRAFSVR